MTRVIDRSNVSISFAIQIVEDFGEMFVASCSAFPELEAIGDDESLAVDLLRNKIIDAVSSDLENGRDIPLSQDADRKVILPDALSMRVHLQRTIHSSKAEREASSPRIETAYESLVTSAVIASESDYVEAFKHFGIVLRLDTEAEQSIAELRTVDGNSIYLDTRTNFTALLGEDRRGAFIASLDEEGMIADKTYFSDSFYSIINKIGSRYKPY